MGPRSPRRPLLACAAALSAAAFGVGCDSAKGGKDAAAASSQRMSEVSVRVDVPAAPEALSLVTTAPGEAPVIERRLLPPAPRVLTAEGEPLGPQFKLDPSADLTLQVQAPPRTFIELRPFGATLALACAIEGGRVFISADHLARLTGPSGRAPVSVEAVWRDSQATALAGRPHRLSVEVRASAVVELRR
jgi:hypothetical protein